MVHVCGGEGVGEVEWNLCYGSSKLFKPYFHEKAGAGQYKCLVCQTATLSTQVSHFHTIKYYGCSSGNARSRPHSFVKLELALNQSNITTEGFVIKIP